MAVKLSRLGAVIVNRGRPGFWQKVAADGPYPGGKGLKGRALRRFKRGKRTTLKGRPRRALSRGKRKARTIARGDFIGPRLPSGAIRAPKGYKGYKPARKRDARGRYVKANPRGRAFRNPGYGAIQVNPRRRRFSGRARKNPMRLVGGIQSGLAGVPVIGSWLASAFGLGVHYIPAALGVEGSIQATPYISEYLPDALSPLPVYFGVAGVVQGMIVHALARRFGASPEAAKCLAVSVASANFGAGWYAHRSADLTAGAGTQAPDTQQGLGALVAYSGGMGALSVGGQPSMGTAYTVGPMAFGSMGALMVGAT